MVVIGSIGRLSKLSARSLGVFRGSTAVANGVSRNQLTGLIAAGVIERELPDVYRMTVVKRSAEQRLRAALMWAGDDSAGAGLSAGEHYRLEGVHTAVPEIIVPRESRVRSAKVIVRRNDDFAPLMVRRYRGLRVTGVEATLVALAHALDDEAFEVACEDARRRGLTGVPALQRFTWKGRQYRFDFAFGPSRTILETNGKRWHDDPNDYEHDNDKWSVPGRLGYRIVLATWEDVTQHADAFIADLTATLAA